MIVKGDILTNLSELDRAYTRATDPKQSLYLSKLAVLELCGWIEMSMDDMILCHSRRKLRLPANKKIAEKEIVNRTYGFEYDRHFRAMLMKTIGLVACERIEAKIDASVLVKFSAQLESLKTVRNSLAHTYLGKTGTTTTIDAPSATRARIADLYDGLKAYDGALRAL